MSEYDALIEGGIIGKVLELGAEPYQPLVAMPVHPLVSLEELERPSPKPFVGRPDVDYSDLDSLDPLYIPRYLVRRWGGPRFVQSPYYLLWQSEAGRGKRLADPKPVRKK